MTVGEPPWLTPTVLALARAAYEERLPGGLLGPVRLLVLADALQEAGCTEESLLRHLRGEEKMCASLPGGQISREPVCWRRSNAPHARGCWALDCILGKE